ncbi:phosphomannomutase CpsG [Thalassotalea euphylliae]|uniref:phosphomannomutase n=1 Tax=Thalassotalea euphylliae TaxID=1655234 RepID=A0A3E0ULB0_9GAMM|nr:phosphomannomutase CpsG [Thalassotalea euphylliae]REL37065.1 phosphomannomutase CpsG [Thalassotalea euphylliae]
MSVLTCFKAYDIRGKLGDELNEDVAYRVGRAFAQHLAAHSVVIGGDVRLSTESLKAALAEGLMDGGADVIDIGLCGTEHIYFATSHLNCDGGICVTASHNPIDYNGMKLVRSESKPISGDSGLFDIKELAEANKFEKPERRGTKRDLNIEAAFTEHLMTYIDSGQLSSLKIVVNAGNGAAGPTLDFIEQYFRTHQIPIEFIKVHHQPDGTFPNGIPNPLLPENRDSTQQAVIEHQADFGIAWDGDFDRCFLFDEHGQFIEGYYIVGLLAENFLAKNAQEAVIHDPRLTWNTIDIVSNAGGHPIQSKTGHAFIKERMRKENAVYGGEMSAHHYFRDFFYCDSGMIPWLLIAELVCVKDKRLSELVGERIAMFPSSGEINNRVKDAPQAINRVKAFYQPMAIDFDETDGISMVFSNWRFNLRSSNTEPVVRLNVESKGEIGLMKEKTQEVLGILLKD